MIYPLVTTPSIDLPITDSIAVFGLAALIFLVAPLLIQRAGLPGIVGIIAVGAAIGPNALGVLERGETIVLLGDVGLLYLLFVAGLEINLTRFLETRSRSVAFGLLSFGIPQAVGTVAGVALLGMSVPTAALFASIFASHTLLAYPVANRLGITDRESITVTVGGTIVTDTVALLLLAVVVAAELGTLDAAFWLRIGIGLAALFAGTWLLVPIVARWFFRTIDQESYYEFLFVLAIAFGAAYAARLAGVEPILGAFLAGLALNRQIPASGPLMNRIEFVGNALFIPFFLLSVGMLVDVRVILAGGETLVVSTILVVAVVATKWVAAWVAGAAFGYTSAERNAMFGLSLGQAAAALAIVLIGVDVGLFGESVLNGTIVLILFASVLSPSIVDRAGRAMVRERGRDAASAIPRGRILVPLSPDAHHHEGLFDLAFAIREEGTTDPIYAVTVVRPGPAIEADLSATTADLALASEYAASAEIPVETQTRVDHNVASSIVRATLENRISTLVVGWDGAESRGQRTFGEVIDRVLVGTDRLVFVARMREPIESTTDVTVVLPPGIEYNAGFREAADRVKRLADSAGAPIRALAIGSETASLEAAFEASGPSVPTTFDPLDGWDELKARLREAAGPSRLIVVVSARRGALGWHPELRTLPKRVSDGTDGNFAIVYPARGSSADDRRFLELR